MTDPIDTDPIDWREAEDATAKALPGLIEQAEAGHTPAARCLLDIYRTCVVGKQPVYPALADYLARCFDRLLDDCLPPDKALHLRRAKSRPSETDSRNEMIAWEVDLQRARGMTL